MIINQIADGDITRYDYINEMWVIKFLNLLTFRIEKAEHEKRQIDLSNAHRR